MLQPITASIASGGLVFGVLRRLGMVSDGTLKPGRGIAFIILVTWVPLAVLCALDGTLVGTVQVPFLRDPAVHARLLLALPLLLVAEVVVTLMARRSIGELEDRRLLREEDRADLQAAVDRMVRARDSRMVELIILVGAAALLWLSRHSVIADRVVGASSWLGTAGGLSRAGNWYFTVSLYVSMALAWRWAWWIFLWTRFLVGFLRKRVRVQPGHADGYAGLAFLTTTQGALCLVLAAVSVTAAGRLAGLLLHDELPIKSVIPPAAVVVVFALAVMFGPLLLFAPIVGRAKRRTLLGYDRLGQELVTGFDARWISGRQGTEELLGGPDPSTLIDFAGAYEEVRKTKAMPVDPRRASGAIAAVVLPFLPLALLVMPAKELLKQVVKLLL
ncbi:MAG TPA: hypothetical protein VFX50_03475 [Gemmatimonadales bacterium]|nr:hypothetical protein [Gemmatimonadales bacterium]